MKLMYLILFFCAPMALAAQMWTRIQGPPGASITKLTLSRTDPQHIVGLVRFQTDDTGDQHILYLTTNGGITWTPAAGPQGPVIDHMGTTELVFSGSDPEVLEVVIASQVFRSTDLGGSWTEIPNVGPLTSSFVRCAKEPLIRYSVDTPTDLLRSLDGGMTWIAILEVSPSTIAVIPPRDPSMLYVFTNGSIIRSRDTGRTFDTITVQPAGILDDITQLRVCIDPTDPDVLIAAFDNRLLRSADGGHTWTITSDAFPNDYIKQVHYDSLQAGVFYAVGYKLWKSVDHGTTFTRLATNLPTLSVIDVHDGNIITGAFADQIRRSPDAGKSWQVITGDLRHCIIDGWIDKRRFVSPAPGLLYLSSHTEVFRKGPADTTWRFITPPMINVLGLSRVLTFAVAESDPDLLYVVDPLMLHRSEDGGSTWFSIPVPENDTIMLLRVDPQDPRHLLACAYNISSDRQIILHESTDGGDTWNRRSFTSPQNAYPVDLAIAPWDSRCWLVITRALGDPPNTTLITSNSGESWTTHGHKASLAFADRSGTKTWYTTDYKNDGQRSSFTAFTSDHGSTWQTDPNAPGRFLFNDPKEQRYLWGIGKYGTTHRRYPNGTWITYDDRTSLDVQSAQIDPSGALYMATVSSIYRSNFTPTTVNDHDNVLPSHATIDVSGARIDIHGAGSYLVSIYTLTGSLVSRTLADGTFSCTLPESGVRIINVQTASGSTSKLVCVSQ
jgi:photosystem II stability/assembly factor-like uncharacterized protein